MIRLTEILLELDVRPKMGVFKRFYMKGKHEEPYADFILSQEASEKEIEKLREVPYYFTTVNGNMDISNTKIEKLPDSLTVNGDMDISNTNIEELPDNLTVKGTLYIGSTLIETIPNNLNIERFLNTDDKTPLSQHLSEKELEDLVKGKGGSLQKAIKLAKL